MQFIQKKKTFKRLLLEPLEAWINRAKAKEKPKEISVKAEFSFKLKRK